MYTKIWPCQHCLRHCFCHNFYDRNHTTVLFDVIPCQEVTQHTAHSHFLCHIIAVFLITPRAQHAILNIYSPQNVREFFIFDFHVTYRTVKSVYIVSSILNNSSSFQVMIFASGEMLLICQATCQPGLHRLPLSNLSLVLCVAVH